MLPPPHFHSLKETNLMFFFSFKDRDIRDVGLLASVYSVSHRISSPQSNIQLFCQNFSNFNTELHVFNTCLLCLRLSARCWKGYKKYFKLSSLRVCKLGEEMSPCS